MDFSKMEEIGNHIYKEMMDFICEIFRKKYGETVILGPKASGKTHLIHCLIKNELPDEYKSTDIDDNIKEFLDTPGLEYDVKRWEIYIKDKKNIFYLFDMERFLNQTNYKEYSYNEIVVNQISLLTEYFADKIVDKKMLIIGTHFDKLSSTEQAQTIINELKKEIDLGKAKIIYGSLLNEEETKKMKEEIDRRLK